MTDGRIARPKDNYRCAEVGKERPIGGKADGIGFGNAGNISKRFYKFRISIAQQRWYLADDLNCSIKVGIASG